MKVKITLGLIDSTIETDNKDINSNSISQFSNIDDIMAEKDIVKLATFEPDYFRLDGSFIFPSLNNKYNIGYESANISDENGNINNYIDIKLDEKHIGYGYVLHFLNDEHFVDANIKYYLNGVLIKTDAITNNTLDIYTVYFDKAIDFDEVKIEALKIKPNRRMRLISIILGISQVYDNDVLLSVDSSKTTDLTADYTDAGEITFTFYNTGGFDITNLSDLPEGLQKDIAIDLYYDNKLFNKYKSIKTSVEQNGKLITINGADILYNLNESTYTQGKVYTEGRSLYDIAKDVAKSIDIEVVVDDSLKDIISKGYISEVSYREAFRLIAEAGMCQLEVINGILNIVANPLNNEIVLTDDDIIDDTLVVGNEDIIEGVIVNEYTYSKTSDLTGLAEISDILLTGENQTIYIEYSTQPSVATKTTVNNCTLIEEKYFSEHAEITINGNKNDLAWITIVGYNYNVANVVYKIGLDTNVKEIKNTLITEGMANDIMNYQYAHTKGIYNYEFRTTKEIALNDKIIYNKKVVKIKEINYNLSNENEIINIKGDDDGQFSL